jgi:hypothetical protein
MACSFNSSQARNNAAERRDALSIPPEVWNYFKSNIQDLYVGTSLTLDEIRDYMRQHHLFDAT